MAIEAPKPRAFSLGKVDDLLQGHNLELPFYCWGRSGLVATTPSVFISQA